MRIRVPNLIGGLLCPKVFCYLLQHSQFQSLCYPFSWENNHKNHHIFPRVISQPGNVETTLRPTPGDLVLHRTPPPENVHPSGTHRWPNSPVKLKKKPNAWKCSWEFHPAPRSWGPLGSRKILTQFFLAQGRFGCWRSSILTHFFLGGIYCSHLTSTFFGGDFFTLSFWGSDPS